MAAPINPIDPSFVIMYNQLVQIDREAVTIRVYFNNHGEHKYDACALTIGDMVDNTMAEFMSEMRELKSNFDRELSLSETAEILDKAKTTLNNAKALINRLRIELMKAKKEVELFDQNNPNEESDEEIDFGEDPEDVEPFII